MKPYPIRSLLLSTFLCCAAFGLHAQTPTPATNATKADTEIPDGVIIGEPIARTDGRWMGLTMEGPKLRLNFYNEKKHPEVVDVLRAVIRIDPAGRRAERDVMNPSGDGLALVANKPIRAPWVFKVYVTLINADENAGQTFVVDFNRSEVETMPLQD